MEDIIFILLAVVWLLYSLFKGKSKKKQPEKPIPQSERQPQSEKKEKDFETIFREILGEEEETADDQYAETEPVSRQATVEQEKPEEFEQHTGMTGVSDDFEFSAEGKIETIEDQLDKQDHKKEKHLEVIDLWDDDEEEQPFYFDPRNAVIYSEIIKRKY